MRILFLDDEAKRQIDFAEAARGHTIVLVPTSQGAIEFLNAGRFDMIYLDYQLADNQVATPVALALKGMANHYGTPVVLHTFSDSGAKEMAEILRPEFPVLSRAETGSYKSLWGYRPDHLLRTLTNLSKRNSHEKGVAI